MALLLSPRRVAPGGVSVAPGGATAARAPCHAPGFGCGRAPPGCVRAGAQERRRALRRALAPAYSRPMSAPLPVAALERRLRWPGLPTLFFLGILTVLL